MLVTLFQHCITWVSRMDGTNACVEWAWTSCWVPLGM